MKKQNLPLIILFIIFIVLSIFDAEKLTAAALDGLILWATRVVPCLFPFLFCSKALLSLGIGDLTQKALGGFLKSMALPPQGAYPFTVSLLCGYPAGAVALGDMLKRGVSQEDCAALAPLCHTSGPIFVLGYAASVTGYNGYMLLFCHLGSVICTAFILGVARAKKQASSKRNTPQDEPLAQVPLTKLPSAKASPQDASIGRALADACTGAVSSMLTVGGFITFFSALRATLSLPAPLAALLELTNALTLCPNAPLCCFMLSFSGLCILFQAIALLKKIKPMKFIGIRALSGLISLIFCILWQDCSPFLAAAVLLTVCLLCAFLIFILQTDRDCALPARRSLQGIPQAPQARRWRKPWRPDGSPLR